MASPGQQSGQYAWRLPVSSRDSMHGVSRPAVGTVSIWRFPVSSRDSKHMAFPGQQSGQYAYGVSRSSVGTVCMAFPGQQLNAHLSDEVKVMLIISTKFSGVFRNSALGV